MIIKKQFSNKIFLIKVLKNVNHTRSMFTLKDFSKKIKNIVTPILKKSFSSQPKPILNSHEKKEISEEKNINSQQQSKILLDFYNVMFYERIYPIMKFPHILKDTKTEFYISKIFYMVFLNNNLVFQSKLMKNIMEKIIIKKEQLFNFTQEMLKINKNESLETTFILEDKHITTSISTIYEYLLTFFFAKNQTNVFKVIYKSEHPKSRNLEQQKFSQKMTGQKNHDTEITFQLQKNKFVVSWLDIKLGRKFHYKGNLRFISLKDIKSCEDHINNYQQELAFLNEKYNMSENDIKKLETTILKIKEINLKDGLTIQNKLINIQTEISEITETIRKYNIAYNPNYLVFLPEKYSSFVDFQINSPEDLELLQKFTEIPEIIQLGPNSDNSNIENAIRKSLRLYLLIKKPRLDLMSPHHREYCIFFIKRFFPDYENIEKFLETN